MNDQISTTITRSGLHALAEHYSPLVHEAIIITKPDGGKPQAVYVGCNPHRAIVPIQVGYYRIYVKAKRDDMNNLAFHSAIIQRVTRVARGQEGATVEYVADYADEQWCGDVPDKLYPAIRIAVDAALGKVTPPFYVIPPKQRRR